MQLKPWITLIGLGLLSPYALAGSVANTTICSPITQAAKSTTLQLPKGQQQLFGIRNIGETTIQLRGINTTGSAQAGWDSQLQGGHWSAIALANKPLTLRCTAGGKTIACSTAVTLCQFTDATFIDKAVGSYWVAEDVAGSDIINAIAKRGIDADG